MYYTLNPVYRLCGYRGLPYILYHKHIHEFVGIAAKYAELIKICDGNTDLLPTPELEYLVSSHVLVSSVSPVKPNNDYIYYDNRYFKSVEWAITSSCNLNCRHCFVAKNDQKYNDMFSLEEAGTVIKQLVACGVNEVHLTGGEPLTHPDFIQILKEISYAGLSIERIITNGLLVNDELFNTLKELNQTPLFAVSFDGLGKHEWLRNTPNIEQITLDKIKQIKEAGYDVSVQMCLHKGNIDSVWDTVQYFEKMGIKYMRMMRIGEAPRWLKYNELSLSPEEYYDFALEFTRKYVKTKGKISICIWEFLWYDNHGSIKIRPCYSEAVSDKQPACSDAHSNFFIGSTGEVSPCIPLSGAFMANGISMGNVKKESLQGILSDSPLTQHTFKSLHDLWEKNSKCADCKFKYLCCGGCRAMAYGLTGDFNGIDPLKCAFFYGGYHEKINSII